MIYLAGWLNYTLLMLNTIAMKARFNPHILFFLVIIYVSLYAQEYDVFAILKLSFNSPGETPVTGGICGTAFLVNDSTVITAHHVINDKLMPNEDIKYCQFWLLKRDGNYIEKIFLDRCTFLANLEITLITLSNPMYNGNSVSLKKTVISKGDSVFCLGHVGGSMPRINAYWENNLIKIKNYDLSDVYSDSIGIIIKTMDTSVVSNDVNLEKIEVIQPSFKAIKGMSGGPLFRKDDKSLIGMMSFGLPINSVIKDKVYAISVNQIVNFFDNDSLLEKP